MHEVLLLRLPELRPAGSCAALGVGTINQPAALPSGTRPAFVFRRATRTQDKEADTWRQPLRWHPSPPSRRRGYAHPEVLVSTEWVAQHLKDPKVRLVESNEDMLLYDTGHIPGAVKVDWTPTSTTRCAATTSTASGFEELMRAKGISRRHHRGLLRRQEQLVGHLRLLGASSSSATRTRRSWTAGGSSGSDENRPLIDRRARRYPPTAVHGRRSATTRQIRAFRDEVLDARRSRQGRWWTCAAPRSTAGELLHMPDYPQEGALRGGHIPGAKSVPWASAVDPRRHLQERPSELRAIYERSRASSRTTRSSPTAASASASATPGSCSPTCSATTSVRNYDGSWTEWGNAVGVPIER